jgi:hypothetical protein
MTTYVQTGSACRNNKHGSGLEKDFQRPQLKCEGAKANHALSHDHSPPWQDLECWGQGIDADRMDRLGRYEVPRA